MSVWFVEQDNLEFPTFDIERRRVSACFHQATEEDGHVVHFTLLENREVLKKTPISRGSELLRRSRTRMHVMGGKLCLTIRKLRVTYQGNATTSLVNSGVSSIPQEHRMPSRQKD